MALTAENLAVKYNIDRETVDKFALRSQQNWKKGLKFQISKAFALLPSPTSLKILKLSDLKILLQRKAVRSCNIGRDILYVCLVFMSILWKAYDLHLYYITFAYDLYLG